MSINTNNKNQDLKMVSTIYKDNSGDIIKLLVPNKLLTIINSIIEENNDYDISNDNVEELIELLIVTGTITKISKDEVQIELIDTTNQ